MFSDSLENNIPPPPPASPPLPSPAPNSGKEGIDATMFFLYILVAVLLGSISYSVYQHYFEHSHIKKDIQVLQSQFEKSLSDSDKSSSK